MNDFKKMEEVKKVVMTSSASTSAPHSSSPPRNPDAPPRNPDAPPHPHLQFPFIQPPNPGILQQAPIYQAAQRRALRRIVDARRLLNEDPVEIFYHLMSHVFVSSSSRIFITSL